MKGKQSSGSWSEASSMGVERSCLLTHPSRFSDCLLVFAPWVRVYYYPTMVNPTGKLKRSGIPAQPGVLLRQSPKDLARFWCISSQCEVLTCSLGPCASVQQLRPNPEAPHPPIKHGMVPFWAKRRTGNKLTGILSRAKSEYS